MPHMIPRVLLVCAIMAFLPPLLSSPGRFGALTLRRDIPNGRANGNSQRSINVPAFLSEGSQFFRGFEKLRRETTRACASRPSARLQMRSQEPGSKSLELILNIEEATKLTAAYGGSGLKVGPVSKTESYTLRGLTSVGEKALGEVCAEVPLEHTLAVPFRLGDDPWYCEMAVKLLAAAQGCTIDTESPANPLTRCFAQDLIKSVEFEPSVENSWLLSDSHPQFELFASVVGMDAALELRQFAQQLNPEAEQCTAKPYWNALDPAPEAPASGMLPLMQTCMRRAFLNDEQGTVHLLPVLDLANHPSEGLPNVRAEFGADAVRLRCLEAIPDGAEVLNDYGGADGAVFLLTHGFSPRALRNEQLTVPREHVIAPEVDGRLGAGEEARDPPPGGGLPAAVFAAWGVPGETVEQWGAVVRGEPADDGGGEDVRPVLRTLREVAEAERGRLEGLLTLPVPDHDSESAPGPEPKSSKRATAAAADSSRADSEAEAVTGTARAQLGQQAPGRGSDLSLRFAEGLVRSRVRVLDGAARALALQERIGRHIAPPPEVLAPTDALCARSRFWASQTSSDSDSERASA